MCRRTEEGVGPTVGLPCLRQFVGLLKSPSKHRHGANLITVIPKNRPISVAFYDAHGDTENMIENASRHRRG